MSVCLSGTWARLRCAMWVGGKTMLLGKTMLSVQVVDYAVGEDYASCSSGGLW